jgi:hypothetical protein
MIAYTLKTNSDDSRFILRCTAKPRCYIVLKSYGHDDRYPRKDGNLYSICGPEGFWPSKEEALAFFWALV